MFWHRNKLDREIEQLLTVESVYGDRQVSEAATLLALANAGVELNDEAVEALPERLADAAERYGADPDQVQAALLVHEPLLVERP